MKLFLDDFNGIKLNHQSSFGTRHLHITFLDHLTEASKRL